MTADAGEHPEAATAGEAKVLAGTSADRPLSNPEDDRLGYAPFASALARGIGSMDAPDGLVIAIYGAWGLGKTTVLNFVEHYLENDQPDEFTVVRFNPWWFSGRLDIAAAFFDQLQPIFAKWHVRGKKAKKYVAELARVVGAASGTPIGEVTAEIIKGGPSSVPDLKKKLADVLAAQDKRLLIIIDDIDRLTLDEVAELFAVVKALADFPNTIYLLAFDRDQVAKALSHRTSQSGFDYLEKIVQVPFELPLPERESLRAIFLEGLRDIIGEAASDLFDAEEFSSMLRHGVQPLLRTPRDIVRLTNSMRVTYGAVRGEVNVIDFTALEALRVFEPATYDHIRAHPELFGVVSGLEEIFPQPRDDEKRIFHKQWVDALDTERREPVVQIVSRLFPEIVKVLEVRAGSHRRRIDSIRARAISEADYFPIYFRFGLGDQVVSREIVAGLVASAGEPESFARELLALVEQKSQGGRTHASVMLDELNAQAELGFAVEHIPAAVRTLADVGDQLWIESDDEFMGADNPTRIVWLIAGLLNRIPQDERCDLLKKTITDAHSIGTSALLVRRLATTLGVDPKESTQSTSPDALDKQQALIAKDCAIELEQLAATKIAAAAEADGLWRRPRFLWLMAEWGRWADPGAPSAWLNRVITDDSLLSQLVLSIQNRHATTSGPRYRLDPRWLDPYVPREDVAGAVERLRKTTEDDDVAQACDQYLLELRMLDDGKDPDGFLDRE